MKLNTTLMKEFENFISTESEKTNSYFSVSEILQQARTYAMLAETMKSNYYLGQARKCLNLIKRAA